MKNVKKVLRLLHKHSTDEQDASPNFVADFARSHNIELTSDEIVKISDSFEPVTRVLFRVFKKKYQLTPCEIIAIFPDQVYRGLVTTYMHIGQHSDGDYNHLINVTNPARENEREQVDALKRELENIGYNLREVKRCKIVYK